MEGNQGEEGHSPFKGPRPPQWYVVHFEPAIGIDRGAIFTGAMELRIIKPSLKYVPGQWLFIQVPDVSRYQWHPVSRSFTCLHIIIDPVYAFSLHPSLRSPLRRTTPTFPCTSARSETGPKPLESGLEQGRLLLLPSPRLR